MKKFKKIIEHILFEYVEKREFPLYIESFDGEDAPWYFSYDDMIILYEFLSECIKKIGYTARIEISDVYFEYDNYSLFIYDQKKTCSCWEFDDRSIKNEIIPFIVKCLIDNYSSIID